MNITQKQAEQFNKMKAALKQIAVGYQTPQQLRRGSQKQYGIDYTESLEYAYENIQQLAKNAMKNVKDLTL